MTLIDLKTKPAQLASLIPTMWYTRLMVFYWQLQRERLLAVPKKKWQHSVTRPPVELVILHRLWLVGVDCIEAESSDIFSQRINKRYGCGEKTMGTAMGWDRPIGLICRFLHIYFQEFFEFEDPVGDATLVPGFELLNSGTSVCNEGWTESLL